MNFDPSIVPSRYEEGTAEYQSWINYLQRDYDNGQTIRPQYFDLYFESFGEEYYIKRIEEIGFQNDSWDAPWYYCEELTIPASLFKNEYGMIRFCCYLKTISGVQEQGEYSCILFYQKANDTITISKTDLNPESSYYKTYYAEKRDEGAFPDDGKAAGFVEYDKIYYYDSFYNTILDKDDYCAAWTKSDQLSDNTVVDIYYGSAFDDRNFEYVGNKEDLNLYKNKNTLS